jgi:DNA-binding transcriptional LysR family regulator
MDRFDEMSVFVAVAERGNFAAAAKQLGYSAPKVTRAVAALEERLGTLLLARTTRSVRLTDAGMRLLEDARRVLADLAELEATGAGDGNAMRGLITVTASQLFGRHHVLPPLRRFLARHAGIRARVLLRDDLVNLHEEGVDVAVRIGHLAPDGLQHTTVAHVRRVLVAAPALIARLGVPFQPEHLARFPLIAAAIDVGKPTWTLIVDGEPCQVPLAPVLSISTNDAAIDAAVAGLGITRVMSYQVAAPLAAGALRIVLPEFEPKPLPVRVLLPPQRTHTPRVSAFASHLAAALQADPALN